MIEQENTDLVRRVYDMFKMGDMAGMMELYADNIDWQLPEVEDMPSWFGSRSGREGTAEFFERLGEAQDVLVFDPREFIAQGDKVVVLGDYRWRVRDTGKGYGGEWAHAWTIENGKVAAFREYADTAAAAKAHQKLVAA